MLCRPCHRPQPTLKGLGRRLPQPLCSPPFPWTSGERKLDLKGLPEGSSDVQVGWLWNSNASRTKAQLAELRARPKKALGQNFVTDDSVLSRIVKESSIESGDLVLEVGPGTGNLTAKLLDVRHRITAQCVCGSSCTCVPCFGQRQTVPPTLVHLD